MEAKRIQDIEDYCRNVPQTHRFDRKLVPPELEPKITLILRDIHTSSLMDPDNFKRNIRKIWSKYKFTPKKIQLAKIYYDLLDND